MAHGYLGDGYGSHGEIDPDRGSDRRPREGNWRDESRGQERDHDRQMMLRDRNQWRERDRSNNDRWSNRGWGSESYGSDQGFSGSHGEYGSAYQESRSEFPDRSTGRRSFSANPDDHYRSWRDRHMSELDRDYEDYCREREQQFHRDFDDWRRNRRLSGNNREDAIAEESELELTHQRALGEEGNTPSPVGDATLGTNNSENTLPGRARPRG